jgi:hypothetical protein
MRGLENLTLSSEELNSSSMNEILSVIEAGKKGGKARARKQTKAQRIRLARMGGLASGAARRKNSKKKMLTEQNA